MTVFDRIGTVGAPPSAPPPPPPPPHLPITTELLSETLVLRKTDSQTNGRTDAQTGRQTDTYTVGKLRCRGRVESVALLLGSF